MCERGLLTKLIGCAGGFYSGAKGGQGTTGMGGLKASCNGLGNGHEAYFAPVPLRIRREKRSLVGLKEK